MRGQRACHLGGVGRVIEADEHVSVYDIGVMIRRAVNCLINSEFPFARTLANYMNVNIMINGECSDPPILLGGEPELHRI